MLLLALTIAHADEATREARMQEPPTVRDIHFEETLEASLRRRWQRPSRQSKTAYRPGSWLPWRCGVGAAARVRSAGLAGRSVED